MKKLALALSLYLILLGQAFAQVVPTAVQTAPIAATGTATTQTCSAASFGAAFSGRVLVAFLSSDSLTDATITIGGVSAIVNGSAVTNAYIASAIVPTGTSGNIVVTGTGQGGALCFGVYSLAGAANAAQYDAQINAAGNSISINSPANGAIVAVGGSVTTAGTWTGVTQDWVDTSFGPPISGGSFANSSAVTGRTVSYSTAVNTLGASFSPSGSPPPSTLHMMPLLGVGK